MIDIVFPNNNEQEFVRLAECIKLDGLCFTYHKPKDISQFQKDTKLKLFSAIVCDPQEVRKFRGNHITIVRAPDDHTKLRHLFEQVRPDIVFGLELGRRGDFIHHRASGLNHVLARLAKEKGVSIGFSFSQVFSQQPRKNGVYLGRMMQNIRFARKFKFDTVIASFATDPWHLRQPKDLSSFFISLGMTSGEAKTASEWGGFR